jgi:ribonucleoside-diphosphate reductase alpha chain
MGHVRMMAACQPFLSGAISKTVNLPEDATVEEVEQVYYEGWKLGLKALAVYRDNCKVGQPLSDGKAKKKDAVVEEVVAEPVRKRLPKSRPSTTTSFSVGGAEGYMTAGAYADGALGEVFLKLGKQGSTLAGVMDAFSIAVSIGLQYGVPLETFVEKFTNLRFEPAGMTDDADVRIAQSMMDYIFRRLALDYLPFEQRSAMGLYTAAERAAALDNGGEYAPIASADTPKAVAPAAVAAPAKVEAPKPVAVKIEAAPIAPIIGSSSDLLESMGIKSDAPLCMTCGVKMRMSGACFVCEGCGNTSGCS